MIKILLQAVLFRGLRIWLVAFLMAGVLAPAWATDVDSFLIEEIIVTANGPVTVLYIRPQAGSGQLGVLTYYMGINNTIGRLWLAQLASSMALNQTVTVKGFFNYGAFYINEVGL